MYKNAYRKIEASKVIEPLRCTFLFKVLLVFKLTWLYGTYKSLDFISSLSKCLCLTKYNAKRNIYFTRVLKLMHILLIQVACDNSKGLPEFA